MLEFGKRAVVPDINDFNFGLDAMDTFQDIDIKMEDMDSEFSMDHALNLFEFDSMKDLTLELDAVARGDKDCLLDELDTKDKIRQDCMWSTGHQFSRHADGRLSGKACPLLLNEEFNLTPPTSYINQYLNHFNTPLQSDEDASSTSSSDEIDDVVGEWSSFIMDQESRQMTSISSPLRSSTLLSRDTLPAPLLNVRDHSYSTCNSLTPPDSSEDEDSLSGACQDKHQAASELKSQNLRLNEAVRSILKRPVTSPTTTKPKFTFRINLRTKSKHPNHLRWLSKQQPPSRFKKMSSSFTTSLTTTSPSFCLEKPKDARDMHNHMERQRRTELKNAFEVVRKAVPTIAGSERVSKQMILDRAIEYCRGLKQKEATANKHKRLLQDKNVLLRKRLQALQG